MLGFVWYYELPGIDPVTSKPKAATLTITNGEAHYLVGLTVSQSVTDQSV